LELQQTIPDPVFSRFKSATLTKATSPVWIAVGLSSGSAYELIVVQFGVEFVSIDLLGTGIAARRQNK
jgi:hypothetical protein